jgi:hypothetical protein
MSITNWIKAFRPETETWLDEAICRRFPKWYSYFFVWALNVKPIGFRPPGRMSFRINVVSLRIPQSASERSSDRIEEPN